MFSSNKRCAFLWQTYLYTCTNSVDTFDIEAGPYMSQS